MEETVVNEVRAQQIDMMARAKFTKPGGKVNETRVHLAPEVRKPAKTPMQTASWMTHAAKNDLIEV